MKPARAIAVLALLTLLLPAGAGAQTPSAEESALPPGLERAFRKADLDGDGRLSAEESSEAGLFVSESHRDADRDGDGQVTLFELGQAFYSSVRDWTSQTDAADADGDGYLSRDEAEKGAPSIASVFERADTNRDGKLAHEEIVSQVERGYYSETAPQPIVPNIIDKRF